MRSRRLLDAGHSAAWASSKADQGNLPEQIAERNLASRLRKARATGKLTGEHEAELAGMDVEQPAGEAPQLADDVATCLMQDIRRLGRVPKAIKGDLPEHIAERNLAKRLRNARATGKLTDENEAELAGIDVEQPADDVATRLMQEIRRLGRVPKLSKGKLPEQIAGRNLASRLRKARATGKITDEHESELASIMERQLGALTGSGGTC